MEEKNKPKIKKWHIVFFIFFFLTFLGLKFFWQRHYPIETIILKGQELEVEYAKTVEQSHKGLGGREEFGDYDGMIFLFNEPGEYGFVMRDMNFPIDIVWFNRGEVVDIAPNIPTEPGATEQELHHYRPRIEANIVLELPAGWAEAHNLKIGDKLLLINEQ